MMKKTIAESLINFGNYTKIVINLNYITAVTYESYSQWSESWNHMKAYEKHSEKQVLGKGLVRLMQGSKKEKYSNRLFFLERICILKPCEQSSLSLQCRIWFFIQYLRTVVPATPKNGPKTTKNGCSSNMAVSYTVEKPKESRFQKFKKIGLSHLLLAPPKNPQFTEGIYPPLL